MRNNGEVPIAVLGSRCKDTNRVAAVEVGARGGKSLDPAIALADTGGCLKDDEPMPAYVVDPT